MRTRNTEKAVADLRSFLARFQVVGVLPVRVDLRDTVETVRAALGSPVQSA